MDYTCLSWLPGGGGEGAEKLEGTGEPERY